jgi:7,8-dihydropterin-6-yl-methyl-4-(beta-D-ribofuranosyl)aminobenzene 5'-phosphate synthase
MVRIGVICTVILLALCSCEGAIMPASNLASPDQTESASTIEPTHSPDQNAVNPTPTAFQPVERNDMATSDVSKKDRLVITTVYDNYQYNSGLQTAWGFSAFVEYKDSVTLFDTGGDSPTLLRNMQVLTFDPVSIDRIVISHIHNDHIGGLEGLLNLEIHPTVYLLSSFPQKVKERFAKMTEIVEVTEGQAITDDIFTTGQMNTGIPEQALVIKTSNGLVVITGCAHPGVADMVQQAKTLYGNPVYLVMGGFHLRDKSAAEIEAIIAAFRQMGVEKVAPSHCTGDRAIEMFKAEYAENFIQGGVGSVIIIELE